MKTLSIYHEWIPRVGGIESAVYNLAKVLSKDYKVYIVYKGCEDPMSLFRYSDVADVVQVESREISTDFCLVASNHQIHANLKAKKYLQWIHSDYAKYKIGRLKNGERISQYVAVSEHSAKVAKKLYGVEPVVIQNILDPDFPVRKNDGFLRLVTNSRISYEKGFDLKTLRAVKFAKGLQDAGIKFEWIIYGDNSQHPDEFTKVRESFKDVPEVIFAGYRDDVTYGLARADYLVQLSDFEGCPYAVLEALFSGVPCIVTNFDSAGELIQDGVNGYLVPLDMKKIDYHKIATKIPKDFKFSQEGLADKWKKAIGN